MKILTKAILIAALGTSALFAIPTLAEDAKNQPKSAPSAGDTCTTEQVGVAQLDAAKEQLIVCLKMSGSDSPVWQAATNTRRFSLTCEDWSASGFASKDACVMDGRWHLVYQNDENGGATGGSFEDLKRYAEQGADVKNSDAGGVHICQTIGWPTENNNMIVCFDGARVSGNVFAQSITTNDGSIGLGAAARRSDGKRVVSNVLPKSTDGTPKAEGMQRDGSSAFSWFVRF